MFRSEEDLYEVVAYKPNIFLEQELIRRFSAHTVRTLHRRGMNYRYQRKVQYWMLVEIIEDSTV